MQDIAQDTAAKILGALPRLRRYAYVLMGSRERADTYIRLSLEIAVEDIDRLSLRSDVRLHLFQFFHTVLNMIDGNYFPYQVSEPTDDARLHDAVGALAPRSRAVLLLTCMEGFRIEEVGTILGIDPDFGRELLHKAQCEIHRRLGVRILIVEDEKDVADEIGRTVEEMGHSVVGIANNEQSAIAIAHSEHPELVLADLWLNGDDCGIRLAERICSSTDACVLFVTAHPGKLSDLDSSRVITKPFSYELLRSKIEQILPWQGSLNA
jgi:CheY-like chemotaxis protein/DNA-directed RNA polymerase specialized sigma24 family protein